MKYTKFAVAAMFALFLFGTSNAMAFSTEQGSPSKSSNPSDFSDPDENQPPFLSAPDEQSSQGEPRNFGNAPVTFDINPATGMSREDNSDAFNRAFSNK